VVVVEMTGVKGIFRWLWPQTFLANKQKIKRLGKGEENMLQLSLVVFQVSATIVFGKSIELFQGLMGLRLTVFCFVTCQPSIFPERHAYFLNYRNSLGRGVLFGGFEQLLVQVKGCPFGSHGLSTR
jgi:hypothetical protein